MLLPDEFGYRIARVTVVYDATETLDECAIKRNVEAYAGAINDGTGIEVERRGYRPGQTLRLADAIR